jgi:hypothetical protein
MKHFISLILIIFPLLLTAQNTLFEAGELLVQLKQRDTKTFDQQINSEFYRQIDFRKERKVSNNLNVWLYRFNATVNPQKVLQELKALASVQLVQLNHKVSNRSTIPDDTDFASQWHHTNTGQTGGTNDADIDTDEAWDITTGGLSAFGDTIVACILENGGGNLSHPDLIGNAWHNYGEIPNNGIDDDGNGYIDDFDGWNINNDNDDIGIGNHGTQVSSMIGAVGNNNIGISGVNHKVKLMMVRGQSASNEASVLEAYDYPLTMRKLYNTSNGVKGAFIVVTNASWGVDGGDPANFPLWCNMYDSLGKYGILNIGATTNDNSNVEVVGDMPTQCTSDYMIGVTSTDHEDIRVSAGYGTTSVDLAAPGRNVYLANTSGTYGNVNGTSFASPCVAGAVALLYSAPCASFMSLVRDNPQAATDSIRKYLLENVDLIPNLATETVTGGRLNVFNSLNALINSCDNSACIVPFDLGIEDLLDTSVKLTWNGFASDYLLDFRAIGDPNWLRINTGSDFYEVTGIEACTPYEFRVYADCGGDTSETSQILTFNSDGCCVNPILATLSENDASLNIDWSFVLAADSFDIRYAQEGTTDWSIIPNATTPLTLTDLDTCQSYQIEVTTYCDFDQASFGNAILSSTTGCGACLDSTYCTSSGSTNFEYLDSVFVGSISNGSGENGGYAVFDEQQTIFGPGNYSIKLVPGYTGFNYTENYLVYIDFNQDGEFTPSTELVLNTSSNATINEVITIPSTFTEGLTKMRVAMVGGSTLASPCPSGSFYGEIEDYCVILDQTASLNEYSIAQFSMFPNPSSGLLTIQSSSNEMETALIYNSNGQIIQEIAIGTNQTNVDISNLTNGIYFVQLQSSNQTSEVQRLIISK